MRILNILVLIIIFSIKGYCQESINGHFDYKAIYNLIYQPDSTEVNSKKTEEMVLYIGDEVSRFSSEGISVGDSIRKSYEDRRRNMQTFTEMQSKIPSTKFRYYIYKGIPKGKMTFAEKVVKDYLMYVQDKDLMEWQIGKETKEINSYKVQKATTNFAGRDYIAWFTTEIPIADGPYKFNGLPGLIIKISDKKDHYTFELKEFVELDVPKPFSFNTEKFIKTSEAKFLNAKNAFYRDPYAALEKAGIEIGDPEDNEKRKQNRKKRLMGNNNPIELHR